MLRQRCVTTPQFLYPQRKVGLLETGYEASFLVLAAAPPENPKAVDGIVRRVKQGVLLDEA